MPSICVPRLNNGAKVLCYAPLSTACGASTESPSSSSMATSSSLSSQSASVADVSCRCTRNRHTNKQVKRKSNVTRHTSYIHCTSHVTSPALPQSVRRDPCLVTLPAHRRHILGFTAEFVRGSDLGSKGLGVLKRFSVEVWSFACAV